jgi:hypothetical protein
MISIFFKLLFYFFVLLLRFIRIGLALLVLVDLGFELYFKQLSLLKLQFIIDFNLGSSENRRFAWPDGILLVSQRNKRYNKNGRKVVLMRSAKKKQP